LFPVRTLQLTSRGGQRHVEVDGPSQPRRSTAWRGGEKCTEPIQFLFEPLLFRKGSFAASRLNDSDIILPNIKDAVLVVKSLESPRLRSMTSRVQLGHARWYQCGLLVRTSAHVFLRVFIGCYSTYTPWCFTVAPGRVCEIQDVLRSVDRSPRRSTPSCE